MAVVGEITESYSTDQFLKGTDTDELVENIESGKISKLEENFKNKIFEEEKKGLSLEALSIDGRAPLNEIALELRARIDVSIEDIESLKTIAKAKGYDHTKCEAEKYLKEVLKKYKELCDKADQALDDYKEATYVKESLRDNGDGTQHYERKTIHCNSDITIDYEIKDESTTKITMKGSKDSDSKFDGDYAKLESAFKAAESYYDDKVEKAIEFKKKADELEVPSTASLPMPIPNDETRPEGVQPDAKKESHVNQNGDGYVLYTNPDGSTVQIKYEKGKITDHKVKNRYGYTTETIKYDENGKVAYKNVWTYHKVEGTDHVYESEYQKYVPGDKDEWIAEGEPKSYGYSYPDSDGNIKNIKGTTPPSDVGEPKAAPGSMRYSQSSISGSESDSDAGTDKNSSKETRAMVSGPDGDYMVPKDFEDLKNNIASEEAGYKDFKLIKGQVLKVDAKGSFLNNYESLEDLSYFKYDAEKGKYYGYTKGGEKGIFGFDPKDLQWGKGELYNGGNNIELKTNEYAQNQIDKFYEGSISEEELMNTKDPHQLQKTYGGMKDSKSDTGTKTYSDLTAEEKKEFDAGLEELKNNIDGEKFPPQPSLYNE